MGYKVIKRFLDLFFSIVLILLLSPIFLIAGILILMLMSTPIFFTQKRIGMNNKEFRIYKFRSMYPKSEIRKTDVERITFFGKFLRVSRVDELPQLLNILKGDMSFIGPRPLLPEYLPYYTQEELKRHEVRPGLSGLSQVSLSYPDWEEQFNCDVEYVDQVSFILDVKILLKTVVKVLRPTKKLASGNAGRERFDIYRKINNNYLKK